MEDIERIKERLDNIRSVEPIITSLRTISAGAWRQALRRREATALYLDNLSTALGGLLSGLSVDAIHSQGVVNTLSSPQRVIMLVIASERGLCGAFNDTVLDGALNLLQQQRMVSDQVQVITVGERARVRVSAHYELLSHIPLPMTRVVSFPAVRELALDLQDQVFSGRVDAVYTVSTDYAATEVLPPRTRVWLPVERDALEVGAEGWPPPIIEGDRQELITHTLKEVALLRLYRAFIESAAAEQAARFRAMEAASSNLARLIEELTLTYHTARQHAITTEMIELASSAGLLRDTDESTRQ